MVRQASSSHPLLQGPGLLLLLLPPAALQQGRNRDHREDLLLLLLLLLLGHRQLVPLTLGSTPTRQQEHRGMVARWPPPGKAKASQQV
jgi:hypothetical protein